MGRPLTVTLDGVVAELSFDGERLRSVLRQPPRPPEVRRWEPGRVNATRFGERLWLLFDAAPALSGSLRTPSGPTCSRA